jgi:hypothetical protein
LASASIQFIDSDQRLRGAMWFYDNPNQLPDDELMEDPEGLTYVFGYSTMEHFRNVLELVRTEKICLQASPEFMWIETLD